MCVLGTAELLALLVSSARATIGSLQHADSDEVAATATDLEAMLDDSIPVISPRTVAVVDQIGPLALVGREIRSYPTLLEELAGPPLNVGWDDELGYLTAECALTALRRDEVQAALSMLFISSLCAAHAPEPAAEALAHIVAMSDAQGAIGLFAQGARRTGTSDAALPGLRARFGLMFASTVVQVHGTWGRPHT